MRTAKGNQTSENVDADTLAAASHADALVDHASRHYRKRLESVAFGILRNRTDAEDVVQRIFLSLRRVDFEGRSSLWTYLYRAAVNGSMNALRSKRRRVAAEQRLLEHEMVIPSASRENANPEARVLEGELLAGVARALLQVKPQHRRVLVLRIMHGLSNSEIAAHEGLPAATVGTWLRRGRQELRKAMRPMLAEVGRFGEDED